MKIFLSNMYKQVMDLNKSNMLIFINENPNAKMLDLGCDNREWSCSLGEKADSKHFFVLYCASLY